MMTATYLIKRLALVAVIWVTSLTGIGVTNAQAPTAAPVFGPVTFGYDYSIKTSTVIDPSNIFPAGVIGIAANVTASNLPAGVQIIPEWFKNGVSDATPAPYTSVGDDTIESDLTDSNGLTAGAYELRFTIDGQVVASGKVQISDAPMIGRLQIGEDVEGISFHLLKPATSFAATTTKLYALYDYYNMPKNARLVSEWFINGTLASNISSLDASGSNQAFASLANKSGIPKGAGEVHILLNGKVLKLTKFQIGN